MRVHAGLSAGLRAALPGRDWSKRWQIYYKPGRSGQRAEGGRMIEEGGVPAYPWAVCPLAPACHARCWMRLVLRLLRPVGPPLLCRHLHTPGAVCKLRNQPAQDQVHHILRGAVRGRSRRLRPAADTWRRCEARATSSSNLSIHAAASISCARALLLLRPLACFEKSLVADHTAAAAWRHAQHATQHVL